MPTSTTVKGLNINELTEAQYDAAVQGGVIGPNELSVLTDVSYVEPSDLATVATTGDYDDLINKPTIPAAIQVSSMPTAGVDELGKIYQFVGATDASYTNGYFYKCVSDGQTPATYSWEQTDVQPAGSSLPDQTGQSGKFLTTDGTDASWAAVSALQNTATGTYSLTILGTPTTATNATNICEGSSVTGEGGLATGRNSTAGKWGAAYGLGASATGMSSVALGRTANVNAQGAIAIGNGAQALNLNGGAGSIAIGQSATANNTGAIQIGQGTNSVANTFKVGNTNGNYELMSADGTIPTARFTTDPVSDGTYVPTLTITSGVATRSWSAPSGGLPSQTGHSGEFLTTDGTDASWAAISALQNTATGTDALTILGTVTTVDRGINVGKNSRAGTYGTSIGYNATATGTASSAMGMFANASGLRSTALGSQAETGYEYAVAIGWDCQARAAGAIQIGGKYNVAHTNSDANTLKVGNANGNYEIMSADGTIPTARFTTDPVSDGTYYPTLTISSGTPTRSWSTISALQNTATGINGLGILGTSSGNYSIVIGSGATDGGAGGGVAIGRNAQAKSTYTVAIGENARANDNGAIGIGGYARVGAEGAIQIGSGTNNETGTVKFMVKASGGFTNYKIMDPDGTIPTDRLTKVNSTITIAVADWNGGTTVTKTVSGITATGVVLVSPDPTDQSAYTSAGILCTAQAADSLTFTCSTTPSADIDVVVVML